MDFFQPIPITDSYPLLLADPDKITEHFTFLYLKKRFMGFGLSLESFLQFSNACSIGTTALASLFFFNFFGASIPFNTSLL